MFPPKQSGTIPVATDDTDISLKLLFPHKQPGTIPFDREHINIWGGCFPTNNRVLYLSMLSRNPVTSCCFPTNNRVLYPLYILAYHGKSCCFPTNNRVLYPNLRTSFLKAGCCLPTNNRVLYLKTGNSQTLLGCCLPTNNSVLYQTWREEWVCILLLSPPKQQGTIPSPRFVSPLNAVVVSPQTTGYYT